MNKTLRISFILILLTSFALEGFSSARVRHKSNQLGTARKKDTTIPESALPDEKRLTRHLVKHYSELGIEGRPMLNASAPLRVWFGLAIMQMDLNERENMLHTSVWCRIKWKDEFLRWDPAEYGNITRVRMSSKKIWIPDIMLYNTASTQILEREVLVVAQNDGTMLWIPHRIYRSSCKVNVEQFPFDHQVCHMTFGSWAYHGNELDLQFHDDFERMDLTDLERENTEWEVLHKVEHRRIQYYDCCADPWVVLNFSLQLKRKLVFSTFILTLPCIFLACMTTVVFWLPPERPDRTGLAMNLFASFLLLLLILVEAAPPTASSVPTLGIYYCFNMVLIMLSIFLSAAVINISRRGANMERVPHWMMQIAQVFGRILCLSISHDYNEQHKSSFTSSRSRRTSVNGYRGNGEVISNNTEVTNRHWVRKENSYSYKDSASESGNSVPLDMCSHRVNDYHVTPCSALHSHMASMERVFRRIEKNSREILSTLKETERQRLMRKLSMQWQIISVILDRLFFIIFVIAIVTSLCFLFPRPHPASSVLEVEPE